MKRLSKLKTAFGSMFRAGASAEPETAFAVTAAQQQVQAQHSNSNLSQSDAIEQQIKQQIKQQIEQQIVRQKLPLIIAGLSLALLPLFFSTPLWCAALYVALVAWRLLAVYRGWPLPSKLPLLLLTGLALLGVLASFQTINGLQAGVPLLLLMLGLKVLESRSQRDLYVLLLFAWFSLAANFLFSQAPLRLLYVLLVLLITGALLLDLSAGPNRLSWRFSGKTVMVKLLQALPIAMLAFFLFPRINGPLWSLPSSGGQGVTGLSSEMAPGSISRLSQSDAVAFRVDFAGEVPQPADLYWRGPVLSEFDGRRWSPFSIYASSPANAAQTQYYGKAIDYTVTLEPHGQKWIFGLPLSAQNELPRVQNRPVQLRQDFHLSAATELNSRSRYQLRSWLNYKLDPQLGAWLKQRTLALPASGAEQARALASQWRSSSNSDAAVVQRALAHFRQQPFTYTLQPPLLGRDPVDEFLFQTQRGFCEHFASAFVVLMRAAGIPARVVTGYQGGEVNGRGESAYLIVRQSDAHAWAEVWLAGEGWTRVDPTSAVAPERVELGLAAALPQGEGLPSLAIRVPSTLRNLRLQLDALQNAWNQWVLGYGPDAQRALLKQISPWLGSLRGMILSLVFGTVLCLLSVAVWLLWRDHAKKPDKIQQAWLRFCRKLAGRGTVRQANEGPAEFMRRAMRAHPTQQAEIKRIAQQYIALRYGISQASTELESTERSSRGFAQQVRQFRAGRARPS